MGIFVDKRLDDRYMAICELMQARPHVVVRQLARNRSEEVSIGRFLNNKFVNPDKMIDSACARTAQMSIGKDVLLIEDTSTMGFGLHSAIQDLSPTGDGSGRGFFLHPVISVDAQTKQCLGLASAKLYDRRAYQEDSAQRRRDRNRERLEQKESYRWYEEAARAAQRDQGAASYTVVADREADIYELLVLLTTLGLGFVIRSFQNRRLSGQPQDKMQDKLDAEPIRGQYQLAVPATDKRSAHTAELAVKWVQLELARPRSGTGTKHLAEQQAVMVIEVKEQASSVVGKEKPIYWRLLTSHAVHDMQDALRIIQYYVQRWMIEQLFRTLKKKGLDMCSAQVGNAHALKNLTALCLITAVQVMQLVQAREQAQGLPIRAAFDTQKAKLIQRLSTSLEGATDKLKNPYPSDSLAFATWVIARLGGWSGYTSQRPPGPITIWNGLQRLNQICEGITLLDLFSKIE